MLTSLRNFIKPTTGLISHSIHWLFSSTNGQVFKRKSVEGNEENEVAIYCVHGTFDRSSAFATLIKRLLPILPEQITHVEMISFSSRAQGKSIEDFSDQLSKKIIKNSHRNIILMGHSRGGLVASYFAENLAPALDINILEIFCISCPWGGSDYAVFPVTAFSTSVNEMKPESEFLKNLNNQILRSKNKYTYFTGDSDYLVSTTQACIEDKNHQQKLTVLDDHGHLSIMTSKRLANHINDSIAQTLLEEKKMHPNKSP